MTADSTPPTDPTPPDASPEPSESGSNRRLVLLASGVAVAVALIVLIVVLVASGGSDNATPTSASASTPGVKPAPPAPISITGTIVAVDAAGNAEKRTKTQGRQVVIHELQSNGSPAAGALMTSVTGGTGAFFFPETKGLTPGKKFLIRVVDTDKTGKITRTYAKTTITVPAKGKKLTDQTIEACFSC